jgi:septum formation protein
MIWNYTDQSELKMKDLSEKELIKYLKNINTETLISYGVYQIEAGGLDLFDYVKGDKDSIMGLPIKKIKEYLKNL